MTNLTKCSCECRWFFKFAHRLIGPELLDKSCAMLQTMELLHGVLCVINAGLGRKEESLPEGNRAVELRPISKDAVDVR